MKASVALMLDEGQSDATLSVTDAYGTTHTLTPTEGACVLDFGDGVSAATVGDVAQLRAENQALSQQIAQLHAENQALSQQIAQLQTDAANKGK